MSQKESAQKLIDENGLRIDGRRLDELRPMKLEVGVLDKACGSASVELGKNRILVGVYGPREAHPKHIALPDRAVVQCRYHMAPFSVEERKSPAPSRREMEISKVIREALEPSVMSWHYPRTAIDIYIEVLQSDGGSRCASIVGASVALADAGIPLRDLVSACAVGKIEGQLAVDLSDMEDKLGEADMPVAVMGKSHAITLLQMDGFFSPEDFDRALDMAVNCCGRIHEMQKDALKSKYLTIKEAAEESSKEET